MAMPRPASIICSHRYPKPKEVKLKKARETSPFSSSGFGSGGVTEGSGHFLAAARQHAH